LVFSRAAAANKVAGDADIWTATATTPTENAVVSAALAQGKYMGTITVVTFTGAALGEGASAGAASSTPGVNVDANGPGSTVWSVGHNWSRAQTVSVGPNQLLVQQGKVATVGDTAWVQ
jgi:hypothetical protein